MTSKFDQIKKKGKFKLSKDDPRSKLELEYFGYEDEIKRDAALSDHSDTKELKKVVKVCAKGAIIVAAVIGISMMVVFSLHLILPEKWQWLNDMQLARMKDIILAASLSGFITTYARRLL